MTKRKKLRKTFGTYLRDLREQRKLNLTTVARKMLLTSSYLYSLENGRNRPATPARINQLSVVLELNNKESRELRNLAVTGRISKEAIGLLGRKGDGFREVQAPQDAVTPKLKHSRGLTIVRIPVQLGTQELEITLEGSLGGFWIKQTK